MKVTAVMVRVKADHVNDFITATLENHRHSLQEPGNLRFDVLQSADDPASFLLYEAYESEEAAAAHKETSHYARWRDTVAAWMAEPRRGLVHRVLAPIDKGLWK